MWLEMLFVYPSDLLPLYNMAVYSLMLLPAPTDILHDMWWSCDRHDQRFASRQMQVHLCWLIILY